MASWTEPQLGGVFLGLCLTLQPVRAIMTERAGTVGFAPDHALKLLPHSTGFLCQFAESCLDLFLRW